MFKESGPSPEEMGISQEEEKEEQEWQEEVDKKKAKRNWKKAAVLGMQAGLGIAGALSAESAEASEDHPEMAFENATDEQIDAIMNAPEHQWLDKDNNTIELEHLDNVQQQVDATKDVLRDTYRQNGGDLADFERQVDELYDVANELRADHDSKDNDDIEIYAKLIQSHQEILKDLKGDNQAALDRALGSAENLKGSSSRDVLQLKHALLDNFKTKGALSESDAFDLLYKFSQTQDSVIGSESRAYYKDYKEMRQEMNDIEWIDEKIKPGDEKAVEDAVKNYTIQHDTRTTLGEKAAVILEQFKEQGGSSNDLKRLIQDLKGLEDGLPESEKLSVSEFAEFMGNSWYEDGLANLSGSDKEIFHKASCVIEDINGIDARERIVIQNRLIETIEIINNKDLPDSEKDETKKSIVNRFFYNLANNAGREETSYNELDESLMIFNRELRAQ